MSHPFVTSNSQEQMFSVSKAIHSIRKSGRARGLQSEGAEVLAGTSVVTVGVVEGMLNQRLTAGRYRYRAERFGEGRLFSLSVSSIAGIRGYSR